MFFYYSEIEIGEGNGLWITHYISKDTITSSLIGNITGNSLNRLYTFILNNLKLFAYPYTILYEFMFYILTVINTHKLANKYRIILHWIIQCTNR